MVRLPWGSMSTHNTRCPSSANASARLSVVVVLATPPFWLANAITWLISSALFAPAHRNPPRAAHAIFGCRARSARQATAVRDRQGGRREIDGRDRAGPARGAPRPAHDRGGASQPGACTGAVPRHVA